MAQVSWRYPSGSLLNKSGCCYWCLLRLLNGNELTCTSWYLYNLSCNFFSEDANRDYRGLKKYITTIRDSSTSHINPGGDELSSTNEVRDLEARAGSSSSLIPAASVAPETQEQVGSPQLIRRRGSAWTRPAPRIQQAILNIKRPRTWSLSNRRRFLNMT